MSMVKAYIARDNLQAHFVRDFKALVGMSPAAYARRARPSAP